MIQSRDGNSVCVALSGQDGKYVIINIQEGNVYIYILCIHSFIFITLHNIFLF